MDAKDRKNRPARPRSAVIDGQKVLLCNACGIYWQRKGQKRPLKPVKRTSSRKKSKTTINKEDSPFYNAVAETFSIQDADLLWCNCSNVCTSKYLMPDLNDKNSLIVQECQSLIEIHKKALQLKKMKCFIKDEKGLDMMGANSEQDDKRGYGRGRSSTKEYEAFVFQNIDLCKAKKLCAYFRKKLLSFSNDWLYKRPAQRNDSGDDKKGEGRPRVMRDKKFEFSPEEMKTATCCSKLCCQQIWTNQIAQWRKEYVDGNIDQRWNVIQYMLLGEGYGSSKCVNVVRMITGCSRNLVASVRNYLTVNQCTGRPPPRNVGVKKEEPREEDEFQNQHHHVQSLEPIKPVHQLQIPHMQGMGMMPNYPNYSMGGPLLGLVAATISGPPPSSQQLQSQMSQQMQQQQMQQQQLQSQMQPSMQQQQMQQPQYYKPRQ